MSSKIPCIGIVIGSTRDGRFSEKCAYWIHELARPRTDLKLELIDMREYALPFFDEPMSPAWEPAVSETAQRWADKLGTLDGLILVTPEYDYAPMSVLKNAFDSTYKEFIRKPIGFLAYGGVLAARAVEQLRLFAADLQMASVRHAVFIDKPQYLGIWQRGKTFEDYPHLANSAADMLDDIAWWAKALKGAREPA